MAISITNISSNASGTDALSIAISSVTPVSGESYLLSVTNSLDSSGPPPQPTISGTNGWNVTWEAVHSKLWFSSSTPLKRTTLYRGVASSNTAGNVTASAGAEQSAWIAILDQVAGANDSSLIVASNTRSGHVDGSTGGVTLTMNALASSLNAVYVIGCRDANTAMNPESGFTETDDDGHPNPGTRMHCSWAINNTAAAVNVTGTNSLCGIAVEINEASVGGATGAVHIIGGGKIMHSSIMQGGILG